ncbi:MAG: carbohydrate kinase [Bacteroidales bacterium]|nr:carbohydrate kinase [Bacteroidales bacterium]
MFFGIGESVYDIVFKDNQPIRGVAGGSVFNTMISLGRLGYNPAFMSEIGTDKIGEMIISFMEENGVKSDNVYRFFEGKTPVSMAFLNERNEASYDFYMQYPEGRLDIVWPRIDNNDILIFGSYYSINPDLRQTIAELLEYASDRKAIIYYDPNFRKNHSSMALKLMPSIIENLEFADIVRGSDEDFLNLYNETDTDRIYNNHIKFYTPIFICTKGEGGVDLRTPLVKKHYEAKRIDAVSSIGAGDSFNAGLLHSLAKNKIEKESLNDITEEVWDEIINTAIEFASEVCQSMENYISVKFADAIIKK